MKDTYGDEIEFRVDGSNFVIDPAMARSNYVFTFDEAREIAREILRLTGDGPTQAPAPAPGIRVGDKFCTRHNVVLTVTGIYTDGVNALYELSNGFMHTSYELIAEGYRRVTLVEGGGKK